MSIVSYIKQVILKHQIKPHRPVILLHLKASKNNSKWNLNTPLFLYSKLSQFAKLPIFVIYHKICTVSICHLVTVNRTTTSILQSYKVQDSFKTKNKCNLLILYKYLYTYVKLYGIDKIRQ